MVLAMVALFVMMCLTTVDAVCRYLLNSPITGAYEITEKYLMLMSYLPRHELYLPGGGLYPGDHPDGSFAEFGKDPH